MKLGLSPMRSNIELTLLGRSPLSLISSQSGPTHVYVLPEEVCPYAKIVPLIPSKAESTIGFPIFSNTSAWVDLTWKI